MQASYGSWQSPITSRLIVTDALRLELVRTDDDDIYWLEGRPAEHGRMVVMRQSPGEPPTDVTPAGFNARTRVHEYGGGSYAVRDGVVYFSNFVDQRLYRQRAGEAPEPLTPESGAALRYADMVVDADRRRLICVHEDHSAGGEAVNSLVSLDLTGATEPLVLASGCDFYASPRVSPDGSQLAWLSWNHPDMPWVGTELWVGMLDAVGAVIEVRKVAGGRDESIFQPEWSPDGTLCFVSDRTNWWNLYRLRGDKVEPLLASGPLEAEFGVPQWVFGQSTYAFISADRLVCAYGREGVWQLAELDLGRGELTPLEIPYTDLGSIRVSNDYVAFLGASPSRLSAVVALDMSNGACRVLRESRPDDPSLHPYYSLPEPLEFPTEDGRTAHAFFYPPHNPDFTGASGAAPPVLVQCHGGPTGAASSALSLRTQFWTSRGVAVLDLNYTGSTGYGREYRNRLAGTWGVADVDDAVNAVRFLAERGRVDGARAAITGGSAGGYTVLCALAFREQFGAGASHFGVSDLELLARDTHKFESRYLDWLIGPYPETQALYYERSPVHFADQVSVPVLFFQGAEDLVVPPSQTEAMVEALRERGIPVGYYLFAGEQHGFRRAENIQRTLEAELAFYALLLFRCELRF